MDLLFIEYRKQDDEHPFQRQRLKIRKKENLENLDFVDLDKEMTENHLKVSQF